MSFPLSWAPGALVGLSGILGAIVLDGGHPAVLLNVAPWLFVGGTAFGGLLVLRGTTGVSALFRTALVGAPAEPAERAARLHDIALLERLSLLGAVIGLWVGGVAAIAALDTPQRLGPALGLAMLNIISATLFSLLFTMPLKQQLLPADKAEERLSPRAAGARGLRILGVIALLVAGITFAAEQTRWVTAPPIASMVSLLMVLAAVLPSVLAAPRAILSGQVSRPRCRGLADALWSTAVLAVTVGAIHVFSVLDQPRLLAPGVALAFAGFVLPAALAMLLNLRGALAPGPAHDDDRSPYPAFTGIAMLGVAGMLALVMFVLQRLAPTD